MFKRILSTALAAGFAAGLLMSVVQALWVIPLIERAEVYEFCAPDLECPPGGALQQATPVKRLAYTALFNILTGVAFGFLLAAGFVLKGDSVGWLRGVAWGAAGFAAFSLAPALGLPPKPPGAAGAPLLESQIWWLACAMATALGLAVLFFAKAWRIKLLGLPALALPHVVGAPLSVGDNSIPPEMMTEFAAASLATTWLFWIALGVISGLVYRRLSLFSPPSNIY